MKVVYRKLVKKFGEQKVHQFKQVTKYLVNEELIITDPSKYAK